MFEDFVKEARALKLAVVIPASQSRRVWLVKPSEGLSTPVVFRHLDYDELSRVDPAGLLHGFMERGLIEAEYVNDLEPPAFKAMPSLQKMKLELEVRTRDTRDGPLYNMVLVGMSISLRSFTSGSETQARSRADVKFALPVLGCWMYLVTFFRAILIHKVLLVESILLSNKRCDKIDSLGNLSDAPVQYK